MAGRQRNFRAKVSAVGDDETAVPAAPAAKPGPAAAAAPKPAPRVASKPGMLSFDEDVDDGGPLALAKASKAKGKDKPAKAKLGRAPVPELPTGGGPSATQRSTAGATKTHGHA